MWKVSVLILEKWCSFIYDNRIFFAFNHLFKLMSRALLSDWRMMLELFEVDKLKTVSVFESLAVRYLAIRLCCCFLIRCVYLRERLRREVLGLGVGVGVGVGGDSSGDEGGDGGERVIEEGRSMVEDG